jgi:hypothetical protein
MVMGGDDGERHHAAMTTGATELYFYKTPPVEPLAYILATRPLSSSSPCRNGGDRAAKGRHTGSHPSRPARERLKHASLLFFTNLLPEPHADSGA